MRWALIAAACALLGPIAPVRANYMIDVGPRDQQCFVEEAAAGTDILVSFAVRAGGRLDIDVSVYGVDGAMLAQSTDRSSDEAFHVKAPVDGKYTCVFFFWNLS